MGSTLRNPPVWERWLSRVSLGRKASAPLPPASQSGGNRSAGVVQLPSPALRWVGAAGRVAVRHFDWTTDADIVCMWQRETYALNFDGFKVDEAFESAFRHDLRRAAIDGNHHLLILDDGAPCGFAWAVLCQNTWTGERYGYINNLYVVPSLRGQGLAKELMAQTEEWFRRRKVKRLRLTVTSTNETAVSLYEKQGFRVARLEMDKEISAD